MRKIIVAKLFLFTTLDNLEKCNLYETRKANFVILDFITNKLKTFMIAADRMFPQKNGKNSLGLKLGNINNNLFINDYLYSVLGNEA